MVTGTQMIGKTIVKKDTHLIEDILTIIEIQTIKGILMINIEKTKEMVVIETN